MRSYATLLIAVITAIFMFIVWGFVYRPDLVLWYLACGLVFHLLMLGYMLTMGAGKNARN